jgi:DnaJ-class molecular chaperone
MGKSRTDSLRALGLHLQATDGEIKHRFRRLSLIYHPDKYNNTLGISKEEATSHFQPINNAYDFLKHQP